MSKKNKAIPINCEGLRSVPYTSLKPFQGSLKEMANESAGKLRASIEKWGWRFPVFVWREGKTDWIHDGHGRMLVLQSMIDDGYTIGDIPVIDIKAKNKREAAELLLAANSKYQTMTDEGLYEFINTMEIDSLDLDIFDLPDIDMDEFKEGYFDIESELPELPDGEKSEYRQITFTLHNIQADKVESVISEMKELGPFVNTNNENSNGNALERLCDIYRGGSGS